MIMAIGNVLFLKMHFGCKLGKVLQIGLRTDKMAF